MARLTAAQRHVVSVLSHSVVTTSMARNVKGMGGFEAHWHKTLSAGDRALVEFFKAELQRIPADIARMLEEEKRDGSPA